jgi:threonine aldolase
MDRIKQAKRVRKVFGGGMRQSGLLAAACNYALDHHIDRLKQDHTRARKIGQLCTELPFVQKLYPVDTNIVIVELKEGFSEKWFLEALSEQGILAVPFGKQLVRFVTHLDFDDADLERFAEGLAKIKSKV